MHYKTDIHKYIDSKGIERIRPIIDIENALDYGWFFYDEINNLSSNICYVKEIVDKLEKLSKGEIDYYEGFGYEVYMIECKKEISQVIDTFDGWKVVAEIPTQEVYELMRDWRDYLIEWETNNKIK
jgi:hypothetical protein